MKYINQKFTEDLLVSKAKKRITIKQLAVITGVNRSTLSDIIKGKTVIVQERTFDKLNDWLLKEEEK
ncbi:hypothetical protein GCM10025878_13170 [Leuconostoc gasicomitatum]|uniref:HTH cro/C1-type domain-containing protein n=2 Tax=Leuconostoc TaxID=1243 RepID=A0AAN2UEZ4_9LACO|nr:MULTISPECIES: helix-turn-helix transcriptional regulator [Leuconostoc]MBZ5945166.1 helix-turn-helix transcriptional regulator [Leuconostoc gasicomitatum]MBZ5957247.1 helix-turn-helix transcriptional regulator [Leuconostoc gasicomitatum]MBZ5958589.1 helix-turn-helix transcriptional regulator [Leuconostoc gasicomitatum]MBZ5962148.1 helix-turn-helix transcriptional regulator [Leuconostoc gasicomitatum]MBZ5966203.1 helix-turn-helix transcriptional regulator [Leuconostoc gasicomitatum]